MNKIDLGTNIYSHSGYSTNGSIHSYGGSKSTEYLCTFICTSVKERTGYMILFIYIYIHMYYIYCFLCAPFYNF